MTPRTRRVGDVLQLERIAVNPDPGIDYVSIGIRSFGKGIFHYEPKPGDQLGSLRFFELHPDRLVISNIKGWEGAVAVSGADDAGTVASNRFLIYQPIDDDEVDVGWARWYFLSEPGIVQLQRASPGSADRNRTLAIDRFEALQIPLPPIEEQRRIAMRLNTIDAVATEVSLRRASAARVAPAVPLSVRVSMESSASRAPTRLGDVLELVQNPVTIDPSEHYVTIGVRSFGRGVFHYPRRPGDQIGKLRFQYVHANLLVISNIKAWEGAVATTHSADAGTLASNRFLFFRPVAGADAIDYFWALLLSPEGIYALGQASPGSADRNRTLAIERFRQIRLPVAGPDHQLEIGRHVRAARQRIAEFESRSESAAERVAALVPAALNSAFGD